MGLVCISKGIIVYQFSVIYASRVYIELLRLLSDFIRMSFMGATSNSDQLRLEGLLNLETIIEKFSDVKDPDFPSVSILEQFQAQVCQQFLHLYQIFLLSIRRSCMIQSWCFVGKCCTSACLRSRHRPLRKGNSLSRVQCLDLW